MKEYILKTDEGRVFVAADSAYIDPKTLVLNHGDFFGVFDRWGDIRNLGQRLQGVFYRGTRYISTCELTILGQKPLLLNSTIRENNEMLVVNLMNPEGNYDNRQLEEGRLHICRKKFIYKNVLYETFKLENYSSRPVRLDLALTVDGDFLDIFDFRGMKRSTPPGKTSYKKIDRGIEISCVGGDNIKRSVKVEASRGKTGERQDTLLIPINLEAKERVNFEVSYLLEEQDVEGQEEKPRPTSEALQVLEDYIQEEKELISNLTTSNHQFNHWITRSRSDLVSLISGKEGFKYPYAGVPWFNTVFGRDGIITALQTLNFAPLISKDVLIYLAKHQSHDTVEGNDAEPGKILHEERSGELANTGDIPFKRYYGSVDSTPLFIVLAGRYLTRTGDKDTLKKIWPNIKMALEWIDQRSKRYHEGFLDYQRHTEKGLLNQGWKDSNDCISHKEGHLAEGPIALCEVQGYAYQAYLEAAKIARVIAEDHAHAGELEKAANDLKKRFNKEFWLEEYGTFALALDKDRRPCEVLSSNPGHCLFSGIVDKGKSQKVAQSLLSEDLFSGWGVRTLAKNERCYNPMSYHNGSIWPHDNAIIAEGLARYGHTRAFTTVLTSIFEASLGMEMQRLPELFCGFTRRQGEGPILYPVACSPQAWAVGSCYQFISSFLGLNIDIINRAITFERPFLPPYLSNVTVENIELENHGSFGFEVVRYAQDVGINVLKKPRGLEVRIVK